MSEPNRAPAEFLEVVKALGLAIEDGVASVKAAFSRFTSENPEFFTNLARIAEVLKNLPEYQRALWAEAALNGWYVNWHTPITINRPISEGRASLDAFMVRHLNHDWEEITASIHSAVPKRKAILQCAFELHAERRYIASIPLFLAQADGVCAEYVGAHLFTDREQREERLMDLQASKGGFTGILLQTLGLHTQFGAGISKHTRKRKELAPNRNGILHGSRRHLDYGTEMNSLKAFSLLAFVVFTLTTNLDGNDA